MNLVRWVKSWLTHRGKALALYRAGMAKANKGDYEGAIANYSAALATPDIPTDVKAMATYNRALAYSAMQEDAKAAEGRDCQTKSKQQPITGACESKCARIAPKTRITRGNGRQPAYTTRSTG